MESCLPDTQTPAVLDVGSGSGLVTLSVLGGRPSRLLFADLDIRAVKESRYETANSRLWENSASVTCRSEDLPFKDDTFDLVLMVSALEHFADDFRALCECSRVLRPGGTIVATVDSTPHELALPSNPLLLSVCKPRIRSRINDGASLHEAILQEHSNLYLVRRRYSPPDLQVLLRRSGFREVEIETLVRSRLGRALYELCVSVVMLSFDVRNPVFRLLSKLYPLIVQTEGKTQSGRGYIVGVSAKSGKAPPTLQPAGELVKDSLA